MPTAMSDLLLPLRGAHVDAAFIELGSASGVRLSAHRGAFLHLLLNGAAKVVSPSASASIIVLAEPGDYAIVNEGRSHVVATEGCSTPRKSDYFQSENNHDAPPTIRVGSGRRTAHILTGRLRIDTSNPLVRALPRLISMTSASSKHTGLLRAELIGNLRGPGSSALVTALFDLLLLQAVRAVGSPLFLSGREGSQRQLRIPLALALIDANLQRNWTIDLLAAEVGVSRSTFAAEFTADVGQAPMTYLTAERIKFAAHMLRTQMLSVAEVAWRVGYQSPSSFSRLFKRHFGISPARYRLGYADLREVGMHRHLHWSAFL